MSGASGEHEADGNGRGNGRCALPRSRLRPRRRWGGGGGAALPSAASLTPSAPGRSAGEEKPKEKAEGRRTFPPPLPAVGVSGRRRSPEVRGRLRRGKCPQRRSGELGAAQVEERGVPQRGAPRGPEPALPPACGSPGRRSRSVVPKRPFAAGRAPAVWVCRGGSRTIGEKKTCLHNLLYTIFWHNGHFLRVLPVIRNHLGTGTLDFKE